MTTPNSGAAQTAPGMMQAMAILTARSMAISGDITHAEFVNIMVDELKEENPLVVMSGIASISYTLLELLAKTEIFGDKQGILFMLSSNLQAQNQG